MAQGIQMSQDTVLQMIGEREVKIQLLTEQINRLATENSRLQARVNTCTCVPKIPAAPAGEGSGT